LSTPAVSGAAASASAASPSGADRRFWLLAGRWFSDWRNPLLIVKPETVLGWQRAGWRAYWRWRSSGQARGGRPAIRGERQALIGRMAAENRLWGQKRIQAELARLGFEVSARTVAKFMRVCRNRGPTGTWREFLTRHASDICACDFSASRRSCSRRFMSSSSSASQTERSSKLK
jgi:hypothetical protein